MRSRPARVVLVALAGGVFALGVGASEARSAKSNQVTITMLVNNIPGPGYQGLIPNFERVYPNITVEATYAPNNPTWYQLESTELAAGNAPDILGALPGSGSPVSISELAKAGDLTPLVNEPWARRSLPLVTSLDKYGQGLYGLTPTVALSGMFTNDALFAKLGLKVPQTFPELIAVCQKAQAEGTVAVLLAGATGSLVSALITQLAVATVYSRDPHWNAELKAGTVSFDGTPGWHQALQEFIDMNDAGCFEPGMPGVTSATGLFAQGQGLLWPNISTSKGLIDALAPQFAYSFHPFPAGSAADQTVTYIQPGTTLSVDAHSSPANQAAARAFIDFVARPEQNALYAKVVGGLTQYQFLKLQLPSFMSSFAAALQSHAYVTLPSYTWWNPNVALALQQDAIGLITGQETIDDVLKGMDAAWNQGPS